MADLPVPEDLVRALRELLAQGRFQDALDAFQRSVGEGVRPPPAAQLFAATAATRKGDLATGASLAAEALERFRSRADDDGRMRAINLLGAIDFERGRLDQSQEYFTEALRLAHQLHDTLMAARASNNLASAVHLRGDLVGALGLYRSALLGFQRLGDRHYIAETYHNLGLTFRQAAEWREAENASAQAVRHAEVLGDRALMALTMTGRAELRIHLGDVAQAFQELERAARLAREAGDEVGGAEIGRIRALAALRQRDFGAAAKEAETALSVAARFGSLLLAAECAAAAAQAHRGLGRSELAERRREEALEGFRRLGAVRLVERFEAEWLEERPSP